MDTRSPRSTSSRPSDAAAIPLPSDDTTPPVTKMYLVVCLAEACIEVTCRSWSSQWRRRPFAIGAYEVFLRIDPLHDRFIDERHTDGNAGEERPKLLEPFDLFEWRGRQAHPFLQRRPVVRVDANMLPHERTLLRSEERRVGKEG